MTAGKQPSILGDFKCVNIPKKRKRRFLIPFVFGGFAVRTPSNLWREIMFKSNETIIDSDLFEGGGSSVQYDDREFVKKHIASLNHLAVRLASGPVRIDWHRKTKEKATSPFMVIADRDLSSIKQLLSFFINCYRDADDINFNAFCDQKSSAVNRYRQNPSWIEFLKGLKEKLGRGDDLALNQAKNLNKFLGLLAETNTVFAGINDIDWYEPSAAVQAQLLDLTPLIEATKP